MTFLFFLFSTLLRKDIVEWNNAMSPLINFFPNQNAPSHKNIRNMKAKENKTIKGKKNSERGYLQFLVFSKIRKHKNTESTAFVKKNGLKKKLTQKVGFFFE